MASDYSLVKDQTTPKPGSPDPGFSVARGYNPSAINHDRIEIDAAIRHGQPVIRGTRVPVARILSEVAAGVAFDEITRQYDVTVDDIRAAIAFAGDLVAEQAFVPVGPSGKKS